MEDWKISSSVSAGAVSVADRGMRAGNVAEQAGLPVGPPCHGRAQYRHRVHPARELPRGPGEIAGVGEGVSEDARRGVLFAAPDGDHSDPEPRVPHHGGRAAG